MRLRLKISSLVILVLFLISCAPKTFTTVHDQSVWYANQVAIRVNELSKTVIQINETTTGVINDRDTREFRDWAVLTLNTLKDVPVGWEKAVLNSWKEAKKKLPQSLLNDPRISLAISILDSLLILINPGAV